MPLVAAVVAFMAEDEARKLAAQAEEMTAVAAVLDAARIPGVRTSFGDDAGKSPTVGIELGERLRFPMSLANSSHFSYASKSSDIAGASSVPGVWRGPTGPELLKLIRDWPRPGHPRVYVGGDGRTTASQMTVVAMMLQPGEHLMVARVLCDVLGSFGGRSYL